MDVGVDVGGEGGGEGLAFTERVIIDTGLGLANGGVVDLRGEGEAAVGGGAGDGVGEGDSGQCSEVLSVKY